jgi:hypothetical protein
MTTMRSEQPVAIVNGGGPDLAAARAVALTSEGAAVVIADLNADGGDDVRHPILDKDAGRSSIAPASLTAERAGDARRRVQQSGKLDSAANIAGVPQQPAPREETTLELWDWKHAGPRVPADGRLREQMAADAAGSGGPRRSRAPSRSSDPMTPPTSAGQFSPSMANDSWEVSARFNDVGDLAADGHRTAPAGWCATDTTPNTHRQLQKGAKMTDQLPAIVSRYFELDVARDTDGLVALFDDDAVVTDEGESRRGASAIRAWRNGPAATYEYTTDITGCEEIDPDHYVVTGRLTGNFPGGSADLKWDFTVRDGRITQLLIAP